MSSNPTSSTTSDSGGQASAAEACSAPPTAPDDGLSEAESAHQQAKQNNAREILTRGQEATAVIIETEVNPDGTALTKLEGVTTFVRPGQCTLTLGATVHVKIFDVGESHADAIALAVEDDGRR